MGLKATASGGDTNFERLEGGGYAGRCVHVIGLGTHLNTHPKAKKGATKDEVLIVWETNEKMEDGRPFTVHKRYTLSLGTKSNLYKDLVAWRSKPFTEKELEGFELKHLLDVGAYLSISKVEKEERTYNNVAGIMPLPNGMALEERVNPLIEFDSDELGSNEDTFKQLWPWVQNIIKKSFQGEDFFKNNPDWGSSEEQEDTDEDIPF